MAVRVSQQGVIIAVIPLSDLEENLTETLNNWSDLLETNLATLLTQDVADTLDAWSDTTSYTMFEIAEDLVQDLEEDLNTIPGKGNPHSWKQSWQDGLEVFLLGADVHYTIDLDSLFAFTDDEIEVILEDSPDVHIVQDCYDSIFYTLTDTLEITLYGDTNLAESMVFQDSLALQLNTYLALSESFTLTDLALTTGSHTSALADSMTMTDAISTLLQTVGVQDLADDLNNWDDSLVATDFGGDVLYIRRHLNDIR